MGIGARAGHDGTCLSVFGSTETTSSHVALGAVVVAPTVQLALSEPTRNARLASRLHQSIVRRGAVSGGKPFERRCKPRRHMACVTQQSLRKTEEKSAGGDRVVTQQRVCNARKTALRLTRFERSTTNQQPTAV